MVHVCLPLEDSNKPLSVDVRVEYQWRPSQCDKCQMFSHRVFSCPLQVQQSSLVHIESPPKETIDSEGFQSMAKKNKGKRLSMPTNQVISPVNITSPTPPKSPSL
ncbi:hypothetical protein Patl1_35305 [Pistacia atlantica]|nr:hypothetical protein Patl1_35305 [Pistacia atlantica]